MEKQKRMARQLLEAWLCGLNEGGHPAPSLDEIREAYKVALAEVVARSSEEG